MSYIIEKRTGVKCPVCGKEIIYCINRRRFSKNLQLFEVKLLRNDRFFSEKLECGCDSYVEIFHNIITNWRITSLRKKDLIDKFADELVSSAVIIVKAIEDVKR
jgi:hypothetical protein